MHESTIQILEVRADGQERAVTLTAAVTAVASRAIFVALSEQLDRRRQQPTADVEAVMGLREQTALAEQFAPYAAAGAHAIVRLTEPDLRACLLELARYTDRVDGEHFQPKELRDRLRVLAEIISVLWDANATAAAALAGREVVTRAAN